MLDRDHDVFMLRNGHTRNHRPKLARYEESTRDTTSTQRAIPENILAIIAVCSIELSTPGDVDQEERNFRFE